MKGKLSSKTIIGIIIAAASIIKVSVIKAFVME